jgi:uncharacterized cofD-like protein
MKVVVVGGGTGSFNILTGLSEYPLDLVSIITMMDSGGSSGILRDEFGVLPGGDIRRALVALSEEKIMRDLFSYRFEKGKGLSGHSFGNLFLTVLKDLKGSDAKAIEEASKILRIKGKVLPVTTNDCHLCAELEDGEKLKGESKIDLGTKRVKKVFLDKKAKVYSKCVKEIKEADLIVLGPGDFYTSIIPNLLVDNFSEAIINSNAKVAFVCNIMTKAETRDFSAKEYVHELEKYLGKKPDYVLMNNAKPKKEIIKKYKKEKSIFVKPNYEGIKCDLLKEGDYARHDSKKLAKAILGILLGVINSE